jgi:ribosomal protein L15E
MVRITITPTGPSDVGYSAVCPRVTARIYVDGTIDYLCAATNPTRALRGVVDGSRAMRGLRRRVRR